MDNARVCHSLPRFSFCLILVRVVLMVLCPMPTLRRTSLVVLKMNAPMRLR